MMIALCGCMMQEKEVVEKIKKTYRFVDLIFGTHNIFKLADVMQAATWYCAALYFSLFFSVFGGFLTAGVLTQRLIF